MKQRKPLTPLFLGIDVGSVSTDLVVMDQENQILETLYLSTRGTPIEAVREGLALLGERYESSQIRGVGTTGSGRSIAAVVAGADVVKNEITTHAVAAATVDPSIQTVIEIGGQDSKIILLRHGILWDFAMNTVCAAGTGSFLDRQAERMGISVAELGELAARSREPVRIAGRCAVFAESDIIHKQQLGCAMEDIAGGMARALVRNYLSNVAKGKELLPGFCFQGGVSESKGIRQAFEEALGSPVLVPRYNKVMGAYGAAIIARESQPRVSKFKGFEAAALQVTSRNFSCQDCQNHCEVVILSSGGRQIGCFSDRCGKYQKSEQVLPGDLLVGMEKPQLFHDAL